MRYLQIISLIVSLVGIGVFFSKKNPHGEKEITVKELLKQNETRVSAACEFRGARVPHGMSIKAFAAESVPQGEACTHEVRTCHDGTMTGSYGYTNCIAKTPGICGFAGRLIPDGGAVLAYQVPSVPYRSACKFEKRKCADQVLSGSYEYEKCVAEPPKDCIFNGVAVKSGAKVIAYLYSNIKDGPCRMESRTCFNGGLQGTYPFSACKRG